MTQDKHSAVPQVVESPFQRDTLPPSPDKAKAIEYALHQEVAKAFDAMEIPPTSRLEESLPTFPPPKPVAIEKIREGVDYRLVDASMNMRASRTSMTASTTSMLPSPDPGLDLPGQLPASVATGQQQQATWNAALETREKMLRKFEQSLKEKEGRLLEREITISSRNKVVEERERKLREREVRLRDWEARLMDKEAAIKEYISEPPGPPKADSIGVLDTDPPPASAPDMVGKPAGAPLPPEPISLRIEVSPGGGVWELHHEDHADEPATRS